jgi:hypothetical protein
MGYRPGHQLLPLTPRESQTVHTAAVLVAKSQTIEAEVPTVDVLTATAELVVAVVDASADVEQQDERSRQSGAVGPMSAGVGRGSPVPSGDERSARCWAN